MTNKELEIIGAFLKNLDEYENREMKLVWGKMGEITAKFYTCFEDESDLGTNSEEHISFVFDATGISGRPPVLLNEQKLFSIDYHNFPDEIIVDGVKIN